MNRKNTLLRFTAVALSMPLVGAFADSENHQAAPAVTEASVAMPAPKPNASESHGASLMLGTHVNNRVIENVKTEFDMKDHEVCAHLTLTPAFDGMVTFSWAQDGKHHSDFSTHVKGTSRYRTFACIKTRVGNWTVAVKNDKGELLAEKAFTVGGHHDAPKTESTVQEAAPVAKTTHPAQHETVLVEASTDKQETLEEAKIIGNTEDFKDPKNQTAAQPAAPVETAPKVESLVTPAA